MLFRSAAGGVAAERGRILTAILLRHPALLHEVDHAYGSLELPPMLTRMREAIRAWVDHADVLDSAALMNHLTVSGMAADVEQVLGAMPFPLPAYASPSAMPAEAEAGWWHIFGFLNLDRLRDEVASARSAASLSLTPETQRRAIALKEAWDRVIAGESDGTHPAA